MWVHTETRTNLSSIDRNVSCIFEENEQDYYVCHATDMQLTAEQPRITLLQLDDLLPRMCVYFY